MRQRHGESFSYLKLVPLEGADELNHRNYPDLYYAAIGTAIHDKALGVEGRYKMTDVQTTLPKATIEEYADKPPKKGRRLDQKVKDILKELRYPLNEVEEEDEAEEEEEPRRKKRTQNKRN